MHYPMVCMTSIQKNCGLSTKTKNLAILQAMQKKKTKLNMKSFPETIKLIFVIKISSQK